MQFFPINLDITGRLCVVIGGGQVAFRKVKALVGCNAKVKVISPVVLEAFTPLEAGGAITVDRRGYEPGDLQDAFLVFAATDSGQVQEDVAQEAYERKILFNSADDPARCDFQIPAKVRHGDLLLTISTGGASPALSKCIREQLEQQFGPEYGGIVELFARVRAIVVTDANNSEENRKIFHLMLRAGIVQYAEAGEWQKVRTILQESLPAQADIDSIMDGISNLNDGLFWPHGR